MQFCYIFVKMYDIPDWNAVNLQFSFEQYTNTLNVGLYQSVDCILHYNYTPIYIQWPLQSTVHVCPNDVKCNYSVNAGEAITLD